MVNLGDVIPDEVFAVFKGVIPHRWKDGPSIPIFLKLGIIPFEPFLSPTCSCSLSVADMKGSVQGLGGLDVNAHSLN